MNNAKRYVQFLKAKNYVHAILKIARLRHFFVVIFHDKREKKVNFESMNLAIIKYINHAAVGVGAEHTYLHLLLYSLYQQDEYHYSISSS